MQDERYAFRGKRHLLLPILFLLPQLVITVVFFFYPAGEALLGSVYMEDSFGLSREFVGLDNFAVLFSDPSYLETLYLTFIFRYDHHIPVFQVIVSKLYFQNIDRRYRLVHIIQATVTNHLYHTIYFKCEFIDSCGLSDIQCNMDISTPDFRCINITKEMIVQHIFT